MSRIPRRAQAGFTLVEIAIVLVIIGLLRLAKKRVQESSRTTSAPNEDNLPTKSS